MREQRPTDTVLFLLRFVPAILLLVFHGWGKLQAATAYVLQAHGWEFVGAVASLGLPMPGFFAVCSALAESVGALFLALGFFTRYAAAVVAMNMLVAIYRHVSTQTAFDFPALYLLLAAIFVVIPPGRFSLDAALRPRE